MGEIGFHRNPFFSRCTVEPVKDPSEDRHHMICVQVRETYTTHRFGLGHCRAFDEEMRAPHTNLWNAL